MSKTTGNKRKPPHSWRPPADRWDEAPEAARELGISLNAYMTMRILGGGPPRVRGSAIDRALLAKLIAECAAMRDGLDRIVEVAGQDQDVSRAVEGAARHIEQVAATALLATGRKP
ncbi:hypothetical protein [Ruegeria marina]|uniref:Uncharacterized protein n=1 Tax=Ruegeria marina TaxID=639004 RepID=A0A1G7D8T6_9RHOB|nr:hypothetical protein [Ruegeria marina]SDE47919.1 hypothetical protein SAMN04488239_12055 [Ruegeria marina]